MSFDNQPVQYTAADGDSFVYRRDMPMMNGDLLYSRDGKTYYEFAVSDFAGSRYKHSLSFHNPHHGVKSELEFENDTLVYDGEPYIRIVRDFDESSVEVIPLPTVRKPEYLCESEDGTLYYVSADKYRYTYETFKLFIGDAAGMEEHAIISVDSYRDGGTTYVRATTGTFFAPQQLIIKAGVTPKTPTWTSEDGTHALTFLDPEDFDIVETPDGQVTISKR